MSEDTRVQIAPQAALNEYAAIKSFYENRVLFLAQQVHELSATVAALRDELSEISAVSKSEQPKGK
jgi:hypothetical protein